MHCVHGRLCCCKCIAYSVHLACSKALLCQGKGGRLGPQVAVTQLTGHTKSAKCPGQL